VSVLVSRSPVASDRNRTCRHDRPSVDPEPRLQRHAMTPSRVKACPLVADACRIGDECFGCGVRVRPEVARMG